MCRTARTRFSCCMLALANDRHTHPLFPEHEIRDYVEPTNIRFGGGSAETMLHPVIAVVMLLATALIIVLPRKYAVVPLLVTAFLVPAGQVVVVAGIHFTGVSDSDDVRTGSVCNNQNAVTRPEHSRRIQFHRPRLCAMRTLFGGNIFRLVDGVTSLNQGTWITTRCDRGLFPVEDVDTQQRRYKPRHKSVRDNCVDCSGLHVDGTTYGTQHVQRIRGNC